jgi:hypothetical protein
MLCSKGRLTKNSVMLLDEYSGTRALSSPWRNYCESLFQRIYVIENDQETHASGAACFNIVNLPEDAAETICRSIDILIFALRSWE